MFISVKLCALLFFSVFFLCYLSYLYTMCNHSSCMDYVNASDTVLSTITHSLQDFFLFRHSCGYSASKSLRLRSDLYCVGWGVKLYSLLRLIVVSAVACSDGISRACCASVINGCKLVEIEPHAACEV